MSVLVLDICIINIPDLNRLKPIDKSLKNWHLVVLCDEFQMKRLRLLRLANDVYVNVPSAEWFSNYALCQVFHKILAMNTGSISEQQGLFGICN